MKNEKKTNTTNTTTKNEHSFVDVGVLSSFIAQAVIGQTET
jgi:hypothetical protein